MKSLLRSCLTAYAMAALVTASTAVSADKPQTYEEYRAQQQEAINAYKSKRTESYNAFRSDYIKAYDEYRLNLLNQWDVVKQSSQKVQVSYSEQNSVRSEIDFEGNEIRISVVHSSEDTPSTDKIVKALEEVARQSVAEALSADPVESKLSNSKHPGATTIPRAPALHKEVFESEQAPGKAINAMVSKASTTTRKREYNAENLDAMLTQMSPEQPRNSRDIESSEGTLTGNSSEELEKRKKKLAKEYRKRAADPTKKSITTYYIKMPDSNELEKAQPFLATAQEESKKWGLDLNLTLAIMRAESSFNPMARSHIPAFGLMQIVPSSAGLDVNQKVHQQSSMPSADELYQASTNIHYGTAYLNILNSSYLKGIKDPTSRLYCVISAYNTGAGNVSKAFTYKGRNVSAAVKVINTMTPDEVYDHLMTNLPYKETRTYLRKVNNYRSEYANLTKDIKL
ncbi:transglycosylase SLT domain-containing protein [Ferrimonas sp.]|uniref:transglycosylase SLT domain-containing protein n=1 Tax=Ferrimonas sp. TaxID=2080861 RepID=UPI003A903E21